MQLLRQQFVRSMARPFYYEQKCDMSIEHVYFDAADSESIVDTKRRLIDLFAAQLKLDAGCVERACGRRFGRASLKRQRARAEPLTCRRSATTWA